MIDNLPSLKGNGTILVVVKIKNSVVAMEGV